MTGSDGWFIINTLHHMEISNSTELFLSTMSYISLYKYVWHELNVKTNFTEHFQLIYYTSCMIGPLNCRSSSLKQFKCILFCVKCEIISLGTMVMHLKAYKCKLSFWLKTHILLVEVCLKLLDLLNIDCMFMFRICTTIFFNKLGTNNKMRLK